MTGLLLRWAINVIAVLLAAEIFPAYIQPRGSISVALFALVLGLLNAFVRPILSVLALPLTVITLGLFLLVINAIVYWLAAVLVPSVGVQGFAGAFLGALTVTIVSFVVSLVARR